MIDLGRERALTRLPAICAAQPGSVDLRLPQSPVKGQHRTDGQQIANVGSTLDLPTSLKISEKTPAGLKPVGSVVNTGEGAIQLISGSGGSLCHSEMGATTRRETLGGLPLSQLSAYRDTLMPQGTDGKDMTDGKAMADGKDGDLRRQRKSGGRGGLMNLQRALRRRCLLRAAVYFYPAAARPAPDKTPNLDCDCPPLP